jgi:hypothetical protein
MLVVFVVGEIARLKKAGALSLKRHETAGLVPTQIVPAAPHLREHTTPHDTQYDCFGFGLSII